MAVLAGLLFAVFGVVPVAAIELPNYNMLFIPVVDNQHNDYDNGTYRFTIGNNITDGGMNAVHITNSNSSPYGQLNRLTERNGTFFISDTGGKGYEDEAILLVAVESADADNFRMHIKAEGYHFVDHAPSTAPTYEEVIANGYLDPAYENDLDSSYFLNDYWDTDSIQLQQTWKPAAPPFDSGTNGYFWNNQTSSDGEYKLMFIDLNTSIVGTSAPTGGFNSSYRDLLTWNGNPRITYNISPNYSGKVAFVPYAYVNYTTGGGGYFDKAVGWTSRANGTYQSDWLVNVP